VQIVSLVVLVKIELTKRFKVSNTVTTSYTFERPGVSASCVVSLAIPAIMSLIGTDCDIGSTG
jgi:hypothetical protein